MKLAVCRRAFFTAFAVVTALSLTPRSLSPPIDIWDKLQHLAAYVVLASLAVAAFRGAGVRRWMVLFLCSWGGLLKLAQVYVPGRSSDWLDVVANATGVVVGTAIAELARRLLRRGVPFEGSKPPR